MRKPIFLLAIALLLSGCGKHTGSHGDIPVAYQVEKHKQKAKKSLVRPGVEKKREMVPTVVLDPGHGGYDPGAFNHQIEEKEVCLRCTKLIRRHLEKLGYHVILTRSHDVFISLQKRAEMANMSRSQLFVSLHFNSAPNKSAQGIEIYYPAKAESWRLKRAKEVAKIVLNSIVEATKAESRGVKGGDFHVIRETKMPSILIEAGFITHEEERKKISDEKYLNTMAISIAKGIDTYFKSY